MTVSREHRPSKPRIASSSLAGRKCIGPLGLKRHQTVKEFAAFHAWSVRRVYREIHHGPVVAFRFGGQFMVDVDATEAGR